LPLWGVVEVAGRGRVVGALGGVVVVEGGGGWGGVSLSAGWLVGLGLVAGSG